MAQNNPDFFVQQEDPVTLLSKVRGIIKGGPFSGYRLEIHTNVRTPETIDLNEEWEHRLQESILELRKHKGMDVFQWKILCNDGRRTGIDFHTNRQDVVSHIHLINRNDGDVINVLTAIESNFEFVRRPDAIVDALPTELRQRFVAESNATDVLRQQTARMSELLMKYTDEALQREADLRQRLESEYLAKREALDGASNARNEEIRRREDTVAKSENDLKLREHRGVRRETLEKIQENAGLKFSYSPATSTQSRFIHGAVIASMVLSICVFVAVCGVLSSDASGTSLEDSLFWASVHRLPIPVLYAPALTSIIMLVSSVAFYLRWLRNSHDNLARLDFQNNRLQLDMMRASWIAELILEAQNPTNPDQKTFEIPEQLVSQLSHRLFEDSQSDSAEDPIEALQRYAKQFKKLTVGPVMIESQPRSEAKRGIHDSNK